MSQPCSALVNGSLLRMITMDDLPFIVRLWDYEPKRSFIGCSSCEYPRNDGKISRNEWFMGRSLEWVVKTRLSFRFSINNTYQRHPITSEWRISHGRVGTKLAGEPPSWAVAGAWPFQDMPWPQQFQQITMISALAGDSLWQLIFGVINAWRLQAPDGGILAIKITVHDA